MEMTEAVIHQALFCLQKKRLAEYEFDQELKLLSPVIDMIQAMKKGSI